MGIVSRKADEQKLHEANLARIEQNNAEAQTNIDLLQDNKILEQEFRKRFNQKRAGEHVVIIYPSEQEDRREPLTDQEFLQMYNERQQTATSPATNPNSRIFVFRFNPLGIG